MEKRNHLKSQWQRIFWNWNENIYTQIQEVLIIKSRPTKPKADCKKVKVGDKEKEEKIE